MVRDYGFAPNPFHGYCTLATCKPQIRRTAQLGDYVVGIGSVAQGRGGHLVYCMQVEETLTFEDYWADNRFEENRPLLEGSRKQQYGDNIYWRSKGEHWIQADSHHSLPDGSPNPENLRSDTSVNRVLISSRFAYWGGTGPQLPSQFRDWEGVDLANCGRGYRCKFPQDLVAGFIQWIEPILSEGRLGRPRDWH
jgi:hypothetical protein